MKAELAYLTQPAPRIYMLHLRTVEQGYAAYELTESQLRLMVVDGAAMAYRYAKREEA